MTGTLTLLHIAGAVALLLWGTHMVTTGLARGFGPELRDLIGRGLKGRARACFAGLLVTAVLQSSTATALMATAFAASGTLDLSAGLALMLGANVGTALIVQVLSFDVAAAAPILILFGFLLFRMRADRSKPRNLGRALIGLGLMLTALALLGQCLTAVEATPILRSLVGALAAEPVLAVLAAAMLAWAAHSSVAAILFIVSLGGAGVITLEGALALVLGANLGAALPPYLEAAGAPAARRLPLGNLLVRAAGCAAALPLLDPITAGLAEFGVADPARGAMAFHLALNLALAILVLPWTAALGRLTTRLLPAPIMPESARQDAPIAELPHHLDLTALATPSLALANAALEALHMADLAGAALRDALQAFRTGDRTLAGAAGRRDAAIDRIGLAIRRYLADLGGEEVGTVSADAQARAQEILTFVLNLEHVGDIIAHNLVAFASRRLKRTGEPFSVEELADIERLHAEALTSLQLALAAFLRDDLDVARTVARRKGLLRALERAAIDRHVARLRDAPHDADPAAMAEANALFLRTLRDLRRVHSHVAALCAPLLERRHEAVLGGEDETISAGGPGGDGEDPVQEASSLRPAA